MRSAISLALLAGTATLLGCGILGKGDENTDPVDTGGGGGGGGGSVYETACDRFDECNLLDGMSASECVDYFESCADGLLESEAGDLEAALDECLGESNDTCSTFDNCYLYDVPYC